MITINKDNRDQLYASALGHFFVGLVKADAGLSLAEIRKIELLIYKMRKELPGKYEEIIDLFHKIQKDTDYQDWTPEKHGTEGLNLFKEAIKGDENALNYLDAVLETMEIIIDVGEVTPGEHRFLMRMKKEFKELAKELKSVK